MIIKKYETDFGGKKLVVEISDLADQANGSVLVRYGDTAVFATAVMSNQKKEGLGYFPLSVDYEEKFYAAGMILGSRFVRREGKPSEEAILTSRLIDRTIRPLFNEQIRNEIQVVVLALSVDGVNDPDVPAIIATSLALGISDIPWDGPVGAVRMGYCGGKFIANPSYEERKEALLDNVVCGKDELINMVETSAKEAPEDIVASSFAEAVKEIEKIEEFQKSIIKEIGKEKAEIEISKEPAGIRDFFKKNILKKLEEALYHQDTTKKSGLIAEVKNYWMQIAKEEFEELNLHMADDIFEKNINGMLHDGIINAPDGQEKRPDGRKIDKVRPLSAVVGMLPLSHGSGVFFRGGTHVLSVVTLGGPADVLLIEGMEMKTTKHFMHHYNFPPFSTGETGRMAWPGRREVGHGALAERALSPVIPAKEDFPYTIRVVSESMASNGSTSQGSVCAATLALMDAGVPIKNPIAGIAIGLMSQDKKYKILTDIQGPEDHHGDMDFKCAGSKDGVTAIQMDVKVQGVTVEILEKSLAQAKKARMEILEAMLEVMPEPRKELSKYAPCILRLQINPDKIRDVIGPGGKVINDIIARTGAEIDIEQDGLVFITGRNHEDSEKAKKIIEELTHEYKEGDIVTGPVTRLFEFGAMVEIGPAQEGLIHISELAPSRVDKVTDVVRSGDVVTVKVIGIDEKGRVNLSLKQANSSYSPELDQRNNKNNNDVKPNSFKQRDNRRQGRRE